MNADLRMTVQRAVELAEFVHREGRDPSEHDRAERWLAKRLRGWRKQSEQGTLPNAVRLMLDRELPQWRSPSGDTFEPLARRLGEFHRAHGRWPGTTTGELAERHLYQWCARQRTLAKMGALPQEHRRVLDRLAPGWLREDAADAAWRDRLLALGAFYAEHSRWPKAQNSSLERKLSNWLSAQRQAHRAGQLAGERRDALDSIGPWRANAAPEHAPERRPVEDQPSPTKTSSTSSTYE